MNSTELHTDPIYTLITIIKGIMVLKVVLESKYAIIKGY